MGAIKTLWALLRGGVFSEAAYQINLAAKRQNHLNPPPKPIYQQLSLQDEPTRATAE